ncbi:hypothetical protein [Methylobacterium marchantiae]|uniref:DUF3551 domain-containing protein n=1 Tax=Methylobacterium marchantiae TaxID=600331 RepID=A0ABW3X4A5_9HYPH
MSVVALVAGSICIGGAVQAAPLAAAPMTGVVENGLVTKVAGYCGLGYYPDRFTGRCRGNGSLGYGARRAYGRPYVRPYGRPYYRAAPRPFYRGY